jgi:hypothetical protein
LADWNSAADYHLAGDFHASLKQQTLQTTNKETLDIDACGKPAGINVCCRQLWIAARRVLG